MCVSEEDKQIAGMFHVYNRVRDMLTVQLQQSTTCTCCAAELKLAGGKKTSWDARPRELGLRESTRTVCQSNPCLLRSWKKQKTTKNTLQWLIALSLNVKIDLPRETSLVKN